MPSFQYLKKGCPICQGDRTDCRQSIETDLIFCLSNNSVRGYKAVGNDSHGFTMYAVDGGEGFSKEIINTKRVSMRRKQEERKEFNRQGMLTAEQRSENWGAIAEQLTLNDRHRFDLLSRGLSKSAIEGIGFISASDNQRLETKVSNRMAGVAHDGKGLINRAGMIIPVRNNHQQTIGWQIKTDDSSNGKYVWSAPVQVNRRELSVHTKEEFELPLQFAFKAASRVVGLCEGTLKPLIASDRHNVTFIGASGGNFASSPQLLKSYLVDACESAATDTVVIYPDAGSLSNPNVANQLNKTISTCTNLGYRVLIADWGQLLDKSFPDIDELASLTTVTYLTPAQLKRVADGQDVTFTASLHGGDEEIIERIPAKLAQTVSELQDKVGRELMIVEKQSIKPYTPGCLPDYYVGNASQVRWEIKSEQRIYFYQEAIKKGYPTILDNSAPGTGKSYSVARLSNQFLSGEPGHLWYLSKSSRNPTTAGVEQLYTELPVRNNGFDYDETKLTPLGYPQRRLKKAEDGRKEGNCHLTAAFQSARAKGLSLDLCSKCPFARDCKTKDGDGFGYKHQMSQAMVDGNLRANPKSLVDSMIKAGAIAIVDEPSQALEATTEWKLSVNEVMRTARWLLNLDLYSPIAHDIWVLIKELAAFSMRVSKSNYGFETTEIVKGLPPVGDLTEHLAWVDARQQELEQELSEKRNNSNSINVVPTQWVRAFLEAVSTGYGALNVHNDTITIVTPNARLRSVLEAFRSVIYQDATLSVTKLGLMLDVPTDNILVCEVVDSSSDNLEFVQVTGLGNGSINRTAKQQENLDALQEILSQKHRDLGAIDWKRHAKPGELIFFSDARGSNAFESKSALMLKGVPYPNVSAIANECACYYGAGQRTATQLIYDDALVGELIQAFGRLRANQKHGQKLTIYFASDLNLSFLTNLGYKVTQTPAIAFSKKIASRSQLALSAISKAFKQLGECNISEMAAYLGKSASAISQATKRFGGWKSLSKLLSILMSAPILEAGDRKIEVSDVSIEALLNELSNQPDLVKQLPKLLKASNKIQLVFKIISLLPASVQNQFLAAQG